MRILVIKLSALGDFILALGAMQAIRRHHKDVHITLLTTRPFVDIAERSGYFNDIIVDPRPKFYDVQGWYFLFRALNRGRFSHVYDLQGNDRTRVYRRLFTKPPVWVAGNADKEIHAYERHRAALKEDGIEAALPDVSWMTVDVSAFGLKKPYALMIPGSAPQHPQKRWPAVRYAGLARKLMRDGYQVALLGTKAEAEVIDGISHACPGVVDLSGRTSLYDIATLARDAALAVGNDTGPTHLVALAGCKTVALFCTAASNPHLSAPVGPQVQTVAAKDIGDISVDDVYKALS